MCKKPLATRRVELLGSGPGSLAHAIVQLCIGKADALLRNPVGWRIAVESATGGDAGQPLVILRGVADKHDCR